MIVKHKKGVLEVNHALYLIVFITKRENSVFFLIFDDKLANDNKIQ